MAQGNEFKITLPITGFVTRSVKNESGVDENILVIEGIASDASRDQYNGQMSPDCIIGMAQAINDGAGAPVYHNVKRAEQEGRMAVGLDIDHSDHWTDQIGKLTQASVVYDLTPEMVDAGYVAPLLMVRAEVDTDMSHGRDLARALQKGAQLGMSVWGFVKDAKMEVNRATGETTERFNKVDLRKVAITSKPVNKNTWVAEVRRSMTGVEMEVEEIEVEQEAPAEVAETVARSEEAAPAQSESDMPDALATALEAVQNAPEQVEEVARAEEALEAEVSEEPVEGNTEETVQRSEEQAEDVAAEETEQVVEETVARAETVLDVDAIVAAVLERLGPRPDLEPISRSMTEHGEVIRSLPGMFEAVNGELSRAMSTIDTMQKTIASLQEELAAFKAKLQERQGRKGIVARAEEYAPGGENLTHEQVSYLVREVAKSDKVAAMNILRGALPIPTTEVLEPSQVPLELQSAPDNSPVE